MSEHKPCDVAAVWELRLRELAQRFGLDVDEESIAAVRAFANEPVPLPRGIVVTHYTYDMDPRTDLTGAQFEKLSELKFTLDGGDDDD